jgi:hypothetical protein
MVSSHSFLLAIGAAAAFAASTVFTTGQAVDTSSGKIVGQAANHRSDVSEYLGIPYAQPPIASLRWAAPRAYVGNDTINAFSRVSDGDYALQQNANLLYSQRESSPHYNPTLFIPSQKYYTKHPTAICKKNNLTVVTGAAPRINPTSVGPTELPSLAQEPLASFPSSPRLDSISAKTV